MIFGRYEERRGEIVHHPARDDRHDRNASPSGDRPADRPASEVSH
jgi:hypothetical protein